MRLSTAEIEGKLRSCLTLADELDQLLAEVSSAEQCQQADMTFDSVATVRVQIKELASAAGLERI